MPKKARKSNVGRDIRSAGNRSEAFARGQRRVSTPRGRSSALTLYAQQSQQQVAGAQRREAMDEFYQQRAQESQAQEQLQREREAQVRATALAESQAREQVRQGARAQVRGIRERQAQQRATEQQALSDRLGRAQARVSAREQVKQQQRATEQKALSDRVGRAQERVSAQKKRRQGLLLARQQQQLQVQQGQAQLHQQREQHNQTLAQQRQIESRKAEIVEQIAEQQLAFAREGMSRQDRLIDAHFSQMRGMFLEAQQGQERRLGEIQGRMNEGLRQLQDQRQQQIDITYLNRASGRGLDHSSLAPPPSNTGLQRQLTRSDTTDSEASQLADEILGRGTTSDRRGQARQTTTPMFQMARQNLAKTLSAGDYQNIAKNYDAELRRQERVDRRNKAIALARRQDLLDDAPSPEQLERRRRFIQQGNEPLSLVPDSDESEGEDATNTASPTPRIRKKPSDFFNLPEPEPELEDIRPYIPPRPSLTQTGPSLSENISAGVSQAGQLVGEGISGGLRAGAGVVGGIATGLGEAVYNQLPQPRDVGIALGEGAIAGGKGAIAGIGALAQAGAGAVSDLLEGSSDDDAPQVVSEKPQPLLENVNPLEVITGRFTSGNDTDGWRPTRYKLTDVDGVVGKKVKGKVYYVMKKDGRNVQIVDITNPKLTKWNNVGVARFDKLIKAGKISM